MFVTKKKYEELETHVERLYEVFSNSMKSMHDTEETYYKLLFSIRKRLEIIEPKLDVLNKQSKETNSETFANHCYNMATKLLLEGNVVESELAIRMYEQYK